MRREPLDRTTQAVDHLDLRLPAEQVAGQRDVRLADRRVVLRALDELDPRAGVAQAPDQLGEGDYAYLVRVADVHRPAVVGRGEAHYPLDQVVHVAHRPGLGPVSGHGDRLAGQRLADEGGDRAAVERAHPRAEG